MIGKTSGVRVVALEGGIATLYIRKPGCQSGLSDPWIFVLISLLRATRPGNPLRIL